MLDQRPADRRRGRRDRRHARNDLRAEPSAQARVQVLVGAVEAGIPLAQHDDVPAVCQVRRQPARRFLVEVGEGARVAAGMIGAFGRHRVAQHFLDLARSRR